MKTNFFKNAIEYLKTHGHTKGVYENGHGQVCLLGACAKGNGRSADQFPNFNGEDTPLYDLLSECIKGQERYYDGVAAYNDRPERTEAEVIALLEKVDAKANAEPV